jgi:hypothetical protein
MMCTSVGRMASHDVAADPLVKQVSPPVAADASTLLVRLPKVN